jgi:hypothetical protein
MMSLDNTIWLAGIVAEAVVVGLLIYRRVWRLLPIFFVYLCWDLLSNIISYATSHLFPGSSTNSHFYLLTYLVATIVDSLLQFGVLVELAWSVLRPIRASLPRFTIVLICGLILIVGAAVWMLVPAPGAGGYSTPWRLLLQLEQTVSILRILFFLVLSALSQLLSMGWRDRELQVATGLGLYSIVSLGVTMLQTHQAWGQERMLFNRVAIAGFLCSLLYWLYSFAQQEAKRREFTPQMQNLLLAVAGAARANRATLSSSDLAERRYERKN